MPDRPMLLRVAAACDCNSGCGAALDAAGVCTADEGALQVAELLVLPGPGAAGDGRGAGGGDSGGACPDGVPELFPHQVLRGEALGDDADTGAEGEGSGGGSGGEGGGEDEARGKGSHENEGSAGDEANGGGDGGDGGTPNPQDNSSNSGSSDSNIEGLDSAQEAEPDPKVVYPLWLSATLLWPPDGAAARDAPDEPAEPAPSVDAGPESGGGGSSGDLAALWLARAAFSAAAGAVCALALRRGRAAAGGAPGPAKS
jgi:hypothetical protein